MLKINSETCLKEAYVISAESFVNILESPKPGLMLKTASGEYWCSPSCVGPWLEVLGLQFDDLGGGAWGLSPAQLDEDDDEDSPENQRVTVSQIVSASVARAVNLVESCDSAEVLREAKAKERRYKNRVTVIRAVDARLKVLGEGARPATNRAPGSATASMGRL